MPQLVSSATATPKTDAFNFLSEGAGSDVFEVFLKVFMAKFDPGQLSNEVPLRLVVHRPALRHSCLFTR